MSKEKKIEDKIAETDKKLKEISIFMERLEAEYDSALHRLELTPESIEAYMSDEANFPPEIKEELKIQEKLIDDKINRELSRVKDPQSNEKKSQERSTVQQHWLFVR